MIQASDRLELFPTHPCVKQKSYYEKLINRMYNSYHNASIILLDDQIQIHQSTEYLKRFYSHHEFNNKITMLAEYYQYHQEMPRIFHKQLADTIINYHEDRRNLEYRLVTKKMKEDDYQDLELTQRDRDRPVQKIINNIELSYYNFEQKQVKREIIGQKNNHPKGGPKYKKSNIVSNSNFSHKNTASLKNIKCFKTTQTKEGLKVRDINKIEIQPKDIKGKGSACNSIQSNKNLSRSKSRSNLPAFNFEPKFKRNSVNPFQEIKIGSEKAKSNGNSLVKVYSMKNMGEKKNENKKVVAKAVNLESKVNGDKKQSSSIKLMFKRAMETKKLIKIK